MRQPCLPLARGWLDGQQIERVPPRDLAPPLQTGPGPMVIDMVNSPTGLVNRTIIQPGQSVRSPSSPPPRPPLEGATRLFSFASTFRRRLRGVLALN